MSVGVKTVMSDGSAKARQERPPRAARALVPEAVSLETLFGVERACAYVIDESRASSGALFHQGPLVPPLPTRSTSPWVRFIAERRLHRITLPVVRALVLWA